MKNFLLSVLSLVACILGNAAMAVAQEQSLNFDAQSGKQFVVAEQVQPQPQPQFQPQQFQPQPLQPQVQPVKQQSPVESKPIELRFEPPPVAAGTSPSAPASNSGTAQPPPPAASQPQTTGIGTSLDALFAGNSNSLVARAVGSAEGTRTPSGQRTSAYYGHVDPGNRAWNLGSFSYQHGAASPEEADARQLQRLQSQAQLLEAQAAQKGMQLTLEEKLNGIDLANQAPKAALDSGGYIDWLARARAQGMQGSAAVVWARTRSFIDPRTQRWNAPGLGNTAESITRDQERRMLAIQSALTQTPPSPVAASSTAPSIAPTPSPAPAPSPASTTPPNPATPPTGLAEVFAQTVRHWLDSNSPEAAKTNQTVNNTTPKLDIAQQIMDVDLSEIAESVWSIF
jgi:hypothetical protein